MRLVLGLVGAAVLVCLGARTLHSALRVRHGGEVEAEVATPRRAFLTSMAGTGDRAIRAADVAARPGLMGFGGALAYTTLHDR